MCIVIDPAARQLGNLDDALAALSGREENTRIFDAVEAEARACRQSSQTTVATSWRAARKLRAVFS